MTSRRVLQTLSENVAPVRPKGVKAGLKGQAGSKKKTEKVVVFSEAKKWADVAVQTDFEELTKAAKQEEDAAEKAEAERARQERDDAELRLTTLTMELFELRFKVVELEEARANRPNFDELLDSCVELEKENKFLKTRLEAVLEVLQEESEELSKLQEAKEKAVEDAKEVEKSPDETE